MKLSIVIICWNDVQVLPECLRSVFAETKRIDFEVIVSDNGSTDGSLHYIRNHFPQVQIIENRSNLGFGKGNNAGFHAACGEYVLILNPDTIILERALDKLVSYADRHPSGGCFGCRVLNVDGSVQLSAHPLPTIWGSLMGALFLRWPGRLWDGFCSDAYVCWDGRSDRQIGFQAGCCLLVRGELLNKLEGFDERFFHQFEDADLCRRVWESGHCVLFCSEAEIVHIGGQNRGTYRTKVVLETERSKYKYFHKYYNLRGVIWIRYVSLLALTLRYIGCRLLEIFRRKETQQNRLGLYRIMLKWHWAFDPVRFVQSGEEPDIGYAPLGTPRTTSQKFLESP